MTVERDTMGDDCGMSRRSCHLCPLNGKGDERCLRCPGPPELTLVGHRFVSLDEQPAPDEFIGREGDKSAMRPDGGRGGVTRDLEPEVERALSIVLATLFGTMREDPRDLDIRVFWHLFCGDSTVAVAKRLGVSDECVRKRIRRMAERNPLAVHIVERMARAKGAGRRRGERRDGTFQPELFQCG